MMEVTLKIGIGQKYKIPSTYPNIVFVVQLLGEHELSGYCERTRRLHCIPLSMLPKAILEGYIRFVESAGSAT
jgi:hypothetical protein